MYLYCHRVCRSSMTTASMYVCVCTARCRGRHVRPFRFVVYLVGTKFMSADVFTKATDEWTFKTMRAVLRNEPRADAYGLRAFGWMATAYRASKRR